MPDELKQSNETPTYLGHRSRLRRRFLVDDGSSMPDYEMLELLLMMSIPRRDVKPLAKMLIAKFGDISGVINASAEELMEVSGISENTATLLKLVAVCGLRSASEKFKSREGNLFDGWADFVHYCRQKLAYEEAEKCYAFYFDAALHFLGENEVGNGTTNRTAIDMRKLMQDVIYKNATCVVLAHNHPSGNANPSDEDRFLTEEICDMLYKMNIRLEDHLIVTRGEVFSFKNAGLMPSAEISEMLRQQKKSRVNKK